MAGLSLSLFRGLVHYMNLLLCSDTAGSLYVWSLLTLDLDSTVVLYEVKDCCDSKSNAYLLDLILRDEVGMRSCC